MDKKNTIPEGGDKQDALLARLGGSVSSNGEPQAGIPKEIVEELVPAAAKLLTISLKPTSTLKPARVSTARWVLEQYFRMYTPGTHRSEVHIIDHAAIAKMQRAEATMGEMNNWLRKVRRDRGGNGVSDN